MKIQELIREFTYNGVKLADPNTTFTLVQVRDFYATVYPELINAEIEGPANVGAKATYGFRHAVGTKGGSGSTPPKRVQFLDCELELVMNLLTDRVAQLERYLNKVGINTVEASEAQLQLDHARSALRKVRAC